MSFLAPPCLQPFLIHGTLFAVLPPQAWCSLVASSLPVALLRDDSPNFLDCHVSPGEHAVL